MNLRGGGGWIGVCCCFVCLLFVVCFIGRFFILLAVVGKTTDETFLLLRVRKIEKYGYLYILDTIWVDVRWIDDGGAHACVK